MRHTASSVLLVTALLALMWVQELVDFLVFAGELDYYGIIARSEVGLRGLLFAPFLHVDFAHLVSNSVPFLLLGLLVALRSLLRFVIVTLAVMLLGGFAVWLLAPPGEIHLGASLLVFGYLGYLLGVGVFERSAAGVAVALLVLLVYGGVLWGVLPLVPGVSWQAHLFGFLAGALAARGLSGRGER